MKRLLNGSEVWETWFFFYICYGVFLNDKHWHKISGLEFTYYVNKFVNDRKYFPTVRKLTFYVMVGINKNVYSIIFYHTFIIAIMIYIINKHITTTINYSFITVIQKHQFNILHNDILVTSTNQCSHEITWV